MEPEPPGAAFFCLEPEPTQVGRSRSQSRLRDLGHQESEPEQPKKERGSATLISCERKSDSLTKKTSDSLLCSFVMSDLSKLLTVTLLS